jgi:HPt (histidine-containing phosphotransfer) domain-containing protein
MLKSVKARQQQITVTEAPAVPSSSKMAKPVKPIDGDVLRRLIEYGEENRTKLIELFLASAPTSIADMRRAIEEASTADLSLAAHALKGSCSNFGATPLRELCVQIERAGLNGNTDLTTNLVESAENELHRVIEALRPYHSPTRSP